MTNILKKYLFKRPPIVFRDGIPVFSAEDRYVENYKKIAADHVASIKTGHSNPFIGEELWQTLEQSTRELIIKYAKPGDRLLDVGVGLGRLLGPLMQFERHGIDISLDYLDIARQTGIEVAFSRIEDMPYADHSFDVITVSDVLEHVLDLHFCTREILRVLKPGGTLVVRVPFKEDLRPYLSEDLPYEFIHLRTFDEASLRLHFGKILGMTFLEAASVAPYLQGTPRLRVQLLPEADRIRVEEAAKKMGAPGELLRKITEVNADQFMNWIYDLRDNHHEAYQSVVHELVFGIDINAVFRKAAADV